MSWKVGQTTTIRSSDRRLVVQFHEETVPLEASVVAGDMGSLRRVARGLSHE